MKKWEIWSEGYIITGSENDATFHGEFEGKTFKDAIKALYESSDETTKEYIDVEDLTYWGCRFFDNEADARESFG